MNNQSVSSHSRQNCHWRRWYGFYHRHRIRLFDKIKIILAQGEWSSAKTVTNILYYGECLCLLHCKHLYSWGRITQTIYIPSKIQKISQWNRCSTSEKLVSEQSDVINGVRTSNWEHSSGKFYHWLVMKKSSVSCTKRSTYFQILYCVLERWARTHNQILSGRTDWRGSKVHHKTELWTALMVSQWNSSGIFSQDSPHCSSATKSKSYCQKWAKSQKNLQDGSSSCRCWTTSHGDLKTMNRNTNLAPISFLFMRKDFHQEDGHSSDLDQKRSGNLFMKANHKVNGTESKSWWWSDSAKADTQSSDPQVHDLEECSKANVVGNCQYTSSLMRKRLKLFFAQLFLFISSVFTEQSRICVKNVKIAMSEQGDLLWQDNLIHCLSQQVCWRKHLHLRPMILRKKIYFKSTKNEWKGYHNKLAIRDEPNIRLRCKTNVKNTCFTDEKRGWRRPFPLPPFHPCVHSTRPRVHVQYVPVYAGTTRTCWNTFARGAGTKGDVLNVHTGTCWVDTQVFLRVSHHTPHTTHHTAHTPQHNTRHHNTTTTTPHENRDRERDREREKEDGDRKRREEREERRFIFSVAVHGRF